MTDKSKVKEAVKNIKDQSYNQRDVAILLDLATAYLNNELVEPMSEDKIENILKLVELDEDDIYGKQLRWNEGEYINLKTSAIEKLAHALSGKVGKEVV